MDTDDEDDSQAPAFGSDRAEPGRGLAGSPADRFARTAEPAGARPAWPESDDGTPGRGGGSAAAAAGAASAAAAGGLASRAGAPAAAQAGAEQGYTRDVDDDFYADRDRFARDYGTADARDEPLDEVRAEPKRRRLFGRDKRPRVGDTRRDVPEEPAWEQPRRYEAYPTLQTRRGLPMSGLILALLVLGAAAVAFFLLPGLLGVGNPALPAASTTPGASPTQAAASVAPSTESLAPTPLPTATPLTYTIVRGDTLTRVANKFGVTVEQLLAANPQIKDPNKVNVGDVLIIPTGATITSTPTPTP